MRCPRCDHALRRADGASVALLVCAACGGVWLDGPTAQELAARLHARHPAVDVSNRAAAASLYAFDDLRDPLSCPVCGEGLDRVRGGGGVEIDVCSAHGVWFDRGELAKTVQQPSAVAAVDEAAHHTASGVDAWVVAQSTADVVSLGADLSSFNLQFGAELASSAVHLAGDALQVAGDAVTLVGSAAEVGGSLVAEVVSLIGALFSD